MRRFTTRLILSLMGSCLLLLAAGSHEWEAPDEAKKMKNPHAATDEAMATARTQYDENCKFCHGETGGADGPVAAMLKEKPPPFNDPEAMAKVTDGELFWKITNGKDPMPGYQKKLSDEERWQLVNLIRKFAK